MLHNALHRLCQSGGYAFEKHSVALPYKEVTLYVTKTGLYIAAKEARALRARSHGSGKLE